jgi:MYXO-CTERM domain-containing protein
MRNFIATVAGLAIAGSATAAFNLQITEMWMGVDGPDHTEDWFEITNFGDMAWDQSVDGDLWYDDESMDATDASILSGITSLAAGETAIVVLGDATGASDFFNFWNGDVDLSGTQIGWTDGSGLGQGGDGVTIWAGDPTMSSPLDFASFPDTAGFEGASWDVLLGAFSAAGNASGAVASSGLAGDAGIPAIASPGSIVPAPGAAALFGLAGFAARRRR